MRAARDMSIRLKLIAIITLTSMVALLLACAAFVAYEMVIYPAAVTEQLSIVAQIIAGNSTAPLAFDDRKSVNETLATLRAEPSIVSACVYTSDGRPFAVYLQGESRRDLPRVPESAGARLEAGHLLLFRPIVFDGERIGTVYLKRDLKDMYARLERYAWIVLAVLLASSLAALVLSSRVQRVISEPVRNLADVAMRVSAVRDYSLRVSKRSNDELGVLADRFNEMLAQIQIRSRDLNEAQTALQRHVVELRTEILERQSIQEELLTAKQAAEESSRSKSTFLANMSHELRTPLNAIIGYSEMLQEDAGTQGWRDSIPDLERIRAAGKHLLALINDVLDLSKIEAGKIELIIEDVPVADILNDAVSTAGPLARQNGNQLLVGSQAGLDNVRVDPLKFRQCLYNLLSNACKFTRNGTVTLEAAKAEQDGKTWTEWRVTDTGIGIPPDQMHKLFRPFSQVDASTTRKYGGTGLGLAISQRFCQLMGGAITVTSEPGKGSTFTIRLPRHGDGGLAMEHSPLARIVSGAPATQEPQTNRVLVSEETIHLVA